MSLRRTSLILLTLLAASCAAPGPDGPAPGPPAAPTAAPEDGFVRALRYRRLAYDATWPLETTGRLIEEIWFPDRGIVCNVTEEWNLRTEGVSDLRAFPELHAFHSPILNRYPERLGSEKEIESPTEEVRVPRALAERIFRLADLEKERREAMDSLGAEAVEGGVLHPLKVEVRE